MDGQSACGYLVKRGCCIWRPHPCVYFIKKLPQLVHTLSQHKSVLFSHNLHKPLAPVIVLSPSLFHAETLEKQVSDSERQAEAEKLGGRNLLLCCSAASLCERKSSPGTKRAPSFVQGSTWGLFLLRRYRPPPHTIPPPLCLSPRFSPLSLFSLCYSSVPEFILKGLCSQKQILKNDKKKCFYNFTQSELSITDLPAIGKLLSGPGELPW